MKHLIYFHTAIVAFGLAFPNTSLATQRDIQFRSVDFTTSVIELHNFGSNTQSLNGWRFCSHDENQTRRYTSPTSLNGRSLAPGESFFLHFLNNAPAGDPTRLNISSVGSFATPLDRGPYAIQFYFPQDGVSVRFGRASNVVDHLQWAIDGVDNATADERSDEAQNAGLWTSQSLWISTTATSEQIILNDTTGGLLHGPDNYTVTPVLAPDPVPFAIESITADGNGTVILTWPVTADASYEVQRATSPDPESFSPIGTTSDGTFTDTAAPIGQAFYRVVESLPTS